MPKSEILFQIIQNGKGEIWFKSKYVDMDMELGTEFICSLLGCFTTGDTEEDCDELEAAFRPLFDKVCTPKEVK